MKEISEATRKALEVIAMEESYTLAERGGIDGSDIDDENFPEVSIWSIRAMLERAYLLGREEAKG